MGMVKTGNFDPANSGICAQREASAKGYRRRLPRLAPGMENPPSQPPIAPRVAIVIPPPLSSDSSTAGSWARHPTRSQTDGPLSPSSPTDGRRTPLLSLPAPFSGPRTSPGSSSGSFVRLGGRDTSPSRGMSRFRSASVPVGVSVSSRYDVSEVAGPDASRVDTLPRAVAADGQEGSGAPHTRRGPTWLLLEDLVTEFVKMAELKMSSLLSAYGILEREVDLSAHLRQGVDAAFDRVVSSLGRVSRHYPKLVLDSIMVWRKTKSENVEDTELDPSGLSAAASTTPVSFDERTKALFRERRSLVANMLLCRILLEIIRSNEGNSGGFPRELGAKLEDMLLSQLTNVDPELIASSPNRQANYEMFAEVVGELSKIRFASLADKFSAELTKRASAKEGHLELFISSMRYLSLKLYPAERLEESADFLEMLGQYFHNSHSLRTKHAYAELLVEILEPIGAVASAEVNLLQWSKAVDVLYQRAMKMAQKPRHYHVAIPLLATILSVSPKSFFLSNWSTFLEFFLARLKERNQSIRKIAMTSLARIVWIYMFRCVDSSFANVQRKLEQIFRHVFPMRKRDVFPPETPGSIEALSKIVAYVGNRHWEYCTDFLIMPLVQYDLMSPFGLSSAPGQSGTVGATVIGTSTLSSERSAQVGPPSLISMPSIPFGLNDDAGEQGLAPERTIVGLRAFSLMLTDAEAGVVESSTETSMHRSRSQSGSVGRMLGRSKFPLPVPPFPALILDTDSKVGASVPSTSGDWEFLRRASALLPVQPIDKPDGRLLSIDEQSLASTGSAGKRGTAQSVADVLSTTVLERLGPSTIDSLTAVNAALGKIFLAVDQSIGNLLLVLDERLLSVQRERDKEKDEIRPPSMSASSVSSLSVPRTSLRRGASNSTLGLNVEGPDASNSSLSLSIAPLSSTGALAQAFPGALKKAALIDLAEAVIDCIPRCCPTSLTPELVVDVLSRYLLHVDDGIRRACAAALRRISQIEERGGDASWWMRNIVPSDEEPSHDTDDRGPAPLLPLPEGFRFQSVEELSARVCAESLFGLTTDRFAEVILLLGRRDDSDAEARGSAYSSALSSVTELAKLWMIERVDAFDSLKQDLETGQSSKKLDIVTIAAEEIEGWGLLLILSPIPAVRKHGIDLITIAAELMDQTIGRAPCPSDFPESYRNHTKSVPQVHAEDASDNSRPQRILHIMEAFSELAHKHLHDPAAVAQGAVEAGKFQIEAKRTHLSGKAVLVAVAGSEDEGDNGVWQRCSPELFVFFAKYATKSVLGGTADRVCRGILHIMPHIIAAADQSLPSQERSSASTLVSWAATPYRVLVPLAKFVTQSGAPVIPATDEMVAHWRQYLAFSASCLEYLGQSGFEMPAWESATRRVQPSSMPSASSAPKPPPITTAKSFFQLVLPLLSSEKLPIRQSVIVALGCVSPSNYYPLFHEMQPLLSLIADDTNQRFVAGLEPAFLSRASAALSQKRANSAAGGSSGTSLISKKVSILRTEVAHVFALTSCFVPDDRCRSDEVVCGGVVQYVVQSARFFVDPAVQTDWSLTLCRFYFCGLLEKLYEFLPKLDPEISAAPITRTSMTANARIRQLLSSEMRNVLFRVAESWCGHGLQGPVTLARDTRVINSIIENVKDVREKSNLSLAMHEQRQLLEYAALKCMMALLRSGPLSSSSASGLHSAVLPAEDSLWKRVWKTARANQNDGLEDLRSIATMIGVVDDDGNVSTSFDLDAIFVWIESLFRGSDSTIQGVGKLAVRAMLEHCAENGPVVVRLLKHCYVPANQSLDRACFISLVDTVFVLSDFPCRPARQLVLALTRLCDDSPEIRIAAVKLIGIVQQRFVRQNDFHVDAASSDEIKADDVECGNDVVGGLEHVQKLLATRVAMTLPSLSLEVISELTYWLDVIASTQTSSTQIKLRDSTIRLLLRTMVPWIRGINLTSAFQLDAFLSAQSLELGLDHALAHTSVIHCVLTNLLCLTVRHSDRFPVETERLWRSFTEELSTSDVALQSYKALGLATQGYHNFWARDASSAQAHINKLLDYLLTVGTSVRNNLFLGLAKQIVSFVAKTKAGNRTLVRTVVAEITPQNMAASKSLQRYVAQSGSNSLELHTYTYPTIDDSTASAMDYSPTIPLQFLYVSNLETVLVPTPRRPPFSRAQLAAMLLCNSVFEIGADAFLEFTPLLLHFCVIHLDFNVSVIADDLRTLFLNLVRAAIPSTVAGAEALVKKLGAGIEDRSGPFPPQDDASHLLEFVSLVEDVFSAVDVEVGQKWGQVALTWSTTCTVRNIACRSLQVFRALLPAITTDMLGDLISRLAKTVGSTSDDAQAYASEALTTVHTLVRNVEREDLFLFPQFIWTCVGAMQSPHEGEFSAALQIFHCILGKLDLADAVACDSIWATVPADWKTFPGFQPLLLRGLRSSSTEPNALKAINSLLRVTSAIIDRSEERILFAVLANLPRMAHRLDVALGAFPLQEYLDGEADWKVEEDLANLARLRDYNTLAQQLQAAYRLRFRSKAEYLTFIIQSLREAFFPTLERPALHFVLGLLSNKSELYRHNCLHILKVLLLQIEPTRRVHLLSAESGILTPLMDLLRSSVAEEVLEVLDVIVGSEDLSDARYVFNTKRVLKLTRSISVIGSLPQLRPTSSFEAVTFPTGWLVAGSEVAAETARHTLESVAASVRVQTDPEPAMPFERAEGSNPSLPNTAEGSPMSLVVPISERVDVADVLQNLDEIYNNVTSTALSRPGVARPHWRDNSGGSVRTSSPLALRRPSDAG